MAIDKFKGMFPKQWQFFMAKPSRMNILSGSVRSGKTYVSLLKWALWVGGQPKEQEFLMIGKSLGTLKRNCLNLLQSLVGARNFYWSMSTKEGYLFGRKVYIEGANDERSETKIRGMTLAGAYCDEVCLFPESMFAMLLSRLSDGEGILFATTNPDQPKHWLKKNYMDDPELEVKVWNFYLDDNTYLGADYIRRIKKEYKGVYYLRFILGQWVRAEGLVFEDFASNPDSYIRHDKPKPEELDFVVIGTDFGGNKSKTVFVAVGFLKNWRGIVVLADHAIEGGKGTIDPNRVYKEYIEFVKGVEQSFCTLPPRNGLPQQPIPVRYSFADSAEQYLITGMQGASRKAGITPPVDSMKKAINDRVFFLSRMMAAGRFKMMKGCTTVKESLEGLVWDSKKDEDVLLDKPGETPNDGFDALSYAVERFIPNFEFREGGLAA